jgi:molybdopterin converting factor small subunit
MSSPDRRPGGAKAGLPGKEVEITVRLLASYRRYLPASHDERAGYAVRVVPGTAAGQLLHELPIPAGDRYTFFINGRHADRDQVLREGDVLSVFPAVGGG